MKIYIFIIPLALLSFFSCIDVINLDLPENDKRLVVEGLVTNKDTTYTVKLTKTSKYSFKYYSSTLEKEAGALLIISDNLGNADTLAEKSVGIYQSNPDHIKGIVGRSYRLDIFTKDGKHFTSDPEEMVDVPEIDSIYFERDYNDRHSNYNSYRNTIYLDWQDPADVSNYYLHHTSYFWDTRWQDQVQWSTIFNDNLFNGKYLKKYIARREYDGKNFKIRISRYSLTKKAYEFWNLLIQQLNPQEDGVVSSSAPLIGNIYNANDPDDYALGYFQVSALEVKDIYIDR